MAISVFENWNRYYEPLTGRYLQPEPMIQYPDFVISRAQEGRATPVYAYASNNPVSNYDPDGLYDPNGCKNCGGGNNACRAEAQGIKDPKLKACVLAQCSSSDTKLKCDQKVKDQCAQKDKGKNGKKTGGSSAVGSLDSPLKEIDWCEQPVDSDCQNKALVHELAHSCGWQHGQDPGVPGNSGEISNCMSMK